MNLFQRGEFTLRSGQKSAWKIECDAMTAADWDGLAIMAYEILPPFSDVVGVPRGGIPFAVALHKYGTGRITDPLLIAEDVVTTGGSIVKYRDNYHKDMSYSCIGITVFARAKCPDWVHSIFNMTPRRQDVIAQTPVTDNLFKPTPCPACGGRKGWIDGDQGQFVTCNLCNPQ